MEVSADVVRVAASERVGVGMGLVLGQSIVIDLGKWSRASMNGWPDQRDDSREIIIFCFYVMSNRMHFFPYFPVVSGIWWAFVNIAATASFFAIAWCLKFLVQMAQQKIMRVCQWELDI